MTILVAVIAFAVGTLTRFIRRHPAIGDKLFLSVDPKDRILLKQGRLCNARISSIKAVADVAHGDVGIEVSVINKF